MARRKSGRTDAHRGAHEHDDATRSTPTSTNTAPVNLSAPSTSSRPPTSAAIPTTDLVDLDAPAAQAWPAGSPSPTTTDLVDLDAPAAQSQAQAGTAPVTPLLVDLGAVTPQSPPPAPSASGTSVLVDLGAPAAQPYATLALPSTPLPYTDSTLIDLTSEEVEVSGLTITLRSALNVLAVFPVRALRRDAVKWSQIVKNRERWRNTSGSGLDLANESREVFRSLGLGDDFLRAVAVAGVVEVSIPFTSEDVGWEARIFPWEALLSVATKPWRDSHSLYVVRHLVRSEEDARPSDGIGLLYVESIPAAAQELELRK